MERLLGEPAAVAAWCRQQLRRPPAERPAGLTAELGHAAGPGRAAAAAGAVPPGRQRGRAGREGLVAERGPGEGETVGEQTSGHITPTSSAGSCWRVSTAVIWSPVSAAVCQSWTVSDGRRHGPLLAAEHSAPAVR